MNFTKLTLAVLFSIGVLGWIAPLPAEADDNGILYKVQLRGTNYCHLKFPAIREATLGSSHPELKPSSAGDIVDFYGPCNYDPTGKQAVWNQKLEQSRNRDWRKDG